MADCPVNKIDSNVSGLRYAEEECPRELPVTPVWLLAEPNSYPDFGGQLTTLARNPINPSRQRKKGSVTDLTSSGGWNTDLTATNLLSLMQGFMFADARPKMSTDPINAAINDAVDVAAADGYEFTNPITGIAAGDIVQTYGYSIAANNAVRPVASVTGAKVQTTPAPVDETTPPATAGLRVVGHQFAAGDVAIVMTGGLPTLVSTAGGFNAMGLIPGEWIYLGGDASTAKFANNQGFARIKTITNTVLTFDKVSWAGPIAEAGAGKTIQVFFGTIVRNEFDPALIKRRTYQLERTLGSDEDGPQAEYVVGAVPNQFTLTMQQANKVTADLTFVAMDHETRNGLVGLKAGDRPALPVEDMFNTSSDVTHIRLSSVTPGDAFPKPLFAFATDLTVTINNNVTPNKAIGTLGAIDTSAGTFEVGGQITAYFANVDAMAAVRNNADVTLDLSMVKKNKGILVDIPLMTLGNGRLNVVQDQPIMIPLDELAAESEYGYTLLMMFFDYLPNAAEA